MSLSVAPRASANDHDIRIREVFPGFSAAPKARFIELQLTKANQTQVSGNKVDVYRQNGSLAGTFTFTANITNGLSQASILIGTSQMTSFFGVTPDLVMSSDVALKAAAGEGGSVCYEDVDPTPARIDCVAWGNAPRASAGDRDSLR